LGLALAYIVFPIAKFLSRGKTKKSITYALASSVAVLIVAVPLLVSLFYGLNYLLHWMINNVPALYSGAFVVNLKISLSNMGLGILSERIATELGKLALSATVSASESILNPTWFIELFLKVAIFFVVAFYFVYEGPQVKTFINTHLPKKERFLQELLFSFDKTCYGLFVGHFFTSVIIGIIFGTGYWVIFRPSLLTLLLLTSLMFIIAFLPVIGPWFMYVPLALWHMFVISEGLSSGIVFLVFSLIFLTMIPDFYLRPKLVKYSTEIHPLLIILGFFGGPLLMGAKGIIIGPLVLGLAQAILRLYVEKRQILKELVEHF